jgi:protocatechuate 3,4-dioxygenase beta subunit
VRAEGFASTVVERPDAGKPMEVRLVRGARVTGRVTLEGSGKSVAGATVRAVGARGFDGPFGPAPGTSDAEGRYELADLPAGETTLHATGPGVVTKGGAGTRDGWSPNAVTLEAGKTATLDLVVVSGARATGTVTDAAGKPVVGAAVSAVAEQGGGIRSIEMNLFGGGNTSASGADGVVSFDTLVAGESYAFTATAPGHGPGRAGPLVANDAGPVTFAIKLGAVRTVVVTVVDDGTSQPIVGARVATYGDGPSIRRPPMAVTDREGKAVLGPLGEGTVRYQVSAEGYVASRDGSVEPAQSTLTVRLERAGEVAGRVRFADGKPVIGARVTIQGSGTWLRETTDAEGAFRVRGVPRDGDLTLEVSATDEGGKNLRASQPVKAGKTDVAVTLEPGAPAQGVLTVRVVGPDGKPVPRAEARYVQDRGSWGTNVRDGEVRFDNVRDRTEGHVEVWSAAARDGSPLPYGPARVGPVAAGTTELEVRLPAELLVTGVVRAPDGKGLRGVAVTATATDSGGRSEEHGTARTGDDGSFRLGGLGEGEYELRFQTPPDYVAPARVPARGGASGIVVALERAAQATIRVLDPAGQPVAGARVTARPAGREEWEDGLPRATTDASGAALLRGLDPKQAHTLTVQPPHGRDELRSASPWANWMPKDETIRLERAFVVKGVVKDLAGNPVPGATVYRRGEGNAWNGLSADANGAFTLRDVPAGPVVLRADVGGGRVVGEDAATTTVQAGDVNVVLRIDVGLELRVVVENLAGARWVQVALFAEKDGTTHQIGNQSLRQGREVSFRGLERDVAYTIWAGPTEDGRSLLLPGVRAPGEVKVNLQPGKTIAVRVTSPPGATDVNVGASLPQGGAWLHARPLGDGRFELRGAPDGTSWRVRAWAKVGDESWSGEATVAAGATADVELKPQRPPGR